MKDSYKYVNKKGETVTYPKLKEADILKRLRFKGRQYCPVCFLAPKNGEKSQCVQMEKTGVNSFKCPKCELTVEVKKPCPKTKSVTNWLNRAKKVKAMMKV